MDLRTEPGLDCLIVNVADARIDAAVAIHFKDRMRDVTQDATGRVILDLGNVTFIDSSGLGAVVAAMKQLPQGGTLELAGLQPNVDRVFRLTRMDSVFTIHPDTDHLRRDHAC